MTTHDPALAPGFFLRVAAQTVPNGGSSHHPRGCTVDRGRPISIIKALLVGSGLAQRSARVAMAPHLVEAGIVVAWL